MSMKKRSYIFTFCGLTVRIEFARHLPFNTGDLAKLFKNLPTDPSFADDIEAGVRARREADEGGRCRFTLELTHEVNDRLERLARSKCGGDKGELFRKAIVLLEYAVEAEEKGLRLAITDKNNDVVHTIVGL